MLIPFAAFDGQRWERAWPTIDEWDPQQIDRIRHVWRRRGQPVPDTWQMWPRSGGAPVALAVNGITEVTSHCVSYVGLNTSLPRANTSDDPSWPMRLTAVATHGGVTIDQPVTVSDSSALWRAAAFAIVKSFDRLETAQRKSANSPAPGELMPGSRIVMLSLYADSSDRPSMLYFVARRRYPQPSVPPHEQTCHAEAVIAGWLAPASGGYRVVASQVSLTDCDWKEVETSTPLAIAHRAAETFWFMRSAGYESEQFVLIQTSGGRARRLLESATGGC